MSDEKYTLENVLEMLNGIDNGFSYDQVYFIYHSLNGNDDKSEYFRQQCLVEVNRLNKSIEKLKKQDDLKSTEDLNNLNINNNNNLKDVQ